MELHFVKMHGLGNDFMVVDGINQSVLLDKRQIRQCSDRHFGVGFDQLLLLEPDETDRSDFRYRIFNADGQEVEQCGNGARCVARFARDHGLVDSDTMQASTLGGVISLQIQADGQVAVEMGRPDFSPAAVAFETDELHCQHHQLILDDHTELTIGIASLGNPHALVQVEQVDQAPVHVLGEKIAHHRRFLRQTNVGFMQVVDKDHIRLRVYERGVGQTLACASGACAAVAIGCRWGLLNRVVQVSLPGGQLQVSWPKPSAAMRMLGPVQTVYQGIIELNLSTNSKVYRD